MQIQEAVKTPAPKIAVASRPELEQASLRVLIAAVILAYLLWYVLRDRSVGPEEYEPLALAGGFLVFSGLLTLWILAAPHVSVPRLFLGMVVDNAITTYVVIQMGEGGGAVAFSVYLFITFGNGFRFGRLYLHACQLMGLAGFSLVLVVSPFWSKHVEIGLGFLIALIVLPFYVGALAERIKAERAKAEEALKECIERERRGH